MHGILITIACVQVGRVDAQTPHARDLAAADAEGDADLTERVSADWCALVCVQADLRLADRLGRTVLHWAAASHDSQQLMIALYCAGADPEMTNNVRALRLLRFMTAF